MRMDDLLTLRLRGWRFVDVGTVTLYSKLILSVLFYGVQYSWVFPWTKHHRSGVVVLRKLWHFFDFCDACCQRTLGLCDFRALRWDG